MPDLAFHRYRSRADLAEILALASRAATERAPVRTTWRPGDVVWQLLGVHDAAQPLYRVTEGDESAGLVWFQGDELLMDVRPAFDDRQGEIVAWALGRARARLAAGEMRQLTMPVWGLDAARKAAVAANGFAEDGGFGVGFERALSDDDPAPEPPPGFVLCDSVGVDPEARAEAHRAPWSALDHIGILNARSTFTAEKYVGLAATPPYDPSLDILVKAPDGRFVANTLAWLDAASGVGHFEPVGVHPEFRGRQFTALAMGEAMRRLRARGIRVAQVGTAHFNASAIAAYTAAGFTLTDRSGAWRVTVSPNPQA